MTLAKKRTKPVQPPKSALVYKKYKQTDQAKEEQRRAEAIERMIEAKVSMALRQLLY